MKTVPILLATLAGVILGGLSIAAVMAVRFFQAFNP